MKESVLKSLMRLFAIVSQVHSVSELNIARKVIEDYLKLIVRQDKVRQHLIMYDFYHNNMREREEKTGEKQLSLFSVKAMIICEQANEHLSKKQKIFIFTHILKILAATRCNTIEDFDFVKTIAMALRIDENLFKDCLAFIFDKFKDVHHKKNILIVSKSSQGEEYRFVYKEFLSGTLVFLFIESVSICLFKHIKVDDQLYLTDKKIELNTTYTFEKGAVIKSPLLGSIYYNDVIKSFLHDDNLEKVVFVANELSYKFNNSDIGIEPFNFCEESGQLIGIMGGSGVGKSTLLNLLNGNFAPTTGSVLLNGFNVNHDKEKIQGLIGYVPQDDLLVEELTVFQNLFFNAQLCFKDYSRDKILRLVNRLLLSLDLFAAKDLKVGSPLKKFISGGQRKRLNIALELIREPYVLFVDEPTSGLSSTDSDKVISLLKFQALKGKLVIVNIHQPSSDIFKELDKLIVLDKGGRVVFYGNPQDSLIYLKKYNQLVNAEEGECPTCGNLNPNQILQILESRKVNEFGDFVRERQVDSEEWYNNYRQEQNRDINPSVELKTNLPSIDFKVPSKFKQFKIFSLRNGLTKISDIQFLLINLFEAPVLAFILSWFSKYNSGGRGNNSAYIFSENINIPVYIFMGVVVSIFLGLMLSAEDIIRDRKILKREAFLNLNRFSYFNAKILFVSVMLALQILLFVLIGNSFLQIKGMMFHFWLMFWVSSMVAAMVGLNLSASMQSIVSIYILIPVLLVPQILLGGALLRFDKLNSKLSNDKFVPIVGDIMPSRWAYEALMVHQFSKNSFQKLIFSEELTKSQASYDLNYYLPEIQNTLSDIRRIAMDPNQKSILEQKILLLNSELEKLRLIVPSCFKVTNQINSEHFNVSVYSEVQRSLECVQENFAHRLSSAIDIVDNRYYDLEELYGGRDDLLQIRNENYNESLGNIVLNKGDNQKLLVTDTEIIRKTEPIYLYPSNLNGRAHFFAPVKRIGSFYIETYWFNLFMLLIMGGMFYLSLLFNLLPILHSKINRKKIRLYLRELRARFFNMQKPIIK